MVGGGDSSLRRLKAEHLKKKADQELQDGNYRAAWERYEEAIQAQPSNDILRALYSNCSLAYAKALRFQDALKYADKAIKISPGWPKGYWRRGAAFIGLQNIPAAVQAFFKCWELQPQDAESYNKLSHTIQSLTREQLGSALLDIFTGLEKEKKLEKPVVEATDLAAMQEAAFRLIADSHRGHSPPGPYYSTLLRWKTQGVDPAEAYAVRAAVHHNAKCFLQARQDAQAAIKLLLPKFSNFYANDNANKTGTAITTHGHTHAIITTNTSGKNGTGAAAAPTAAGFVETQSLSTRAKTHAKVSSQLTMVFSNKEEVMAALAAVYCRLGDAYFAEPKHPDRDPIEAFKSYTRATDYDPLSQELRNKVQQATEEMTKEQVDRAALEIYNHCDFPGCASIRGVPGRGGGGQLRPGERIFRVEALLAFPQATPGKLNSRVRELLRKALATTVATASRASNGQHATPLGGGEGGGGGRGSGESENVDLLGNHSAVTLEGIFPAKPPTRPSLEISVHIVVGFNILQGNALVKILQSKNLEKIHDALGGAEVIAALGSPNLDLFQAELVDITPTYIDATIDGENGGGTGHTHQLAVPSKPKLELEVPYKMYRLVTSTGTAVERTDKHPFAMSRVYYDASEKPEEVWVELADGSCRWRQTAGEIRIIALKVPSDLPPRQVKVDISPYHIKVYRLINNKEEIVYLQGRLHRGVIPEDCFWTHCGGEGDDGCCITLRKMNLEVLQKHWAHSESWWVRLFQEHQEIAWDDYEKDYSDLPEEVLEKYRKTEAIKGIERSIEGNERHRREVLQEADDLRKRKRQERLHVLRSGGVHRDWVYLDREG